MNDYEEVLMDYEAIIINKLNRKKMSAEMATKYLVKIEEWQEMAEGVF